MKAGAGDLFERDSSRLVFDLDQEPQAQGVREDDDRGPHEKH